MVHICDLTPELSNHVRVSGIEGLLVALFQPNQTKRHPFMPKELYIR